MKQLVTLVLLAALGLAACGTAAGLSGRPWKLATVNGVASDAEVGITFGSDGRYSANLGCNTGSGSWRLDGSTLTLTDMATTEMACSGQGGVIEDVFVALLKGGPTVSRLETSTGRLTLTGGGVTMEFTTP